MYAHVYIHTYIRIGWQRSLVYVYIHICVYILCYILYINVATFITLSWFTECIWLEPHFIFTGINSLYFFFFFEIYCFTVFPFFFFLNNSIFKFRILIYRFFRFFVFELLDNVIHRNLMTCALIFLCTRLFKNNNPNLS